MAEIKKLSKSYAENRWFAYCERTAKTYDSTEKFDKSRSKDNYRLFPHRKYKTGEELTDKEYYKYRLGQARLWNRKDVKPLVSVVCTLPEGVAPEDEKRFFEAFLNFAVQKFGAENICAANVHKDQSQPHVHLAFIPIVEDRKNGGLKVSAKEKITLKLLKTFHGDLREHMAKTGIKGATDVFTGITKKQGGNLTVKQMKQEREERAVFKLDRAEVERKVEQKGEFINR